MLSLTSQHFAAFSLSCYTPKGKGHICVIFVPCCKFYFYCIFVVVVGIDLCLCVVFFCFHHILHWKSSWCLNITHWQESAFGGDYEKQQHIALIIITSVCSGRNHAFPLFPTDEMWIRIWNNLATLPLSAVGN